MNKTETTEQDLDKMFPAVRVLTYNIYKLVTHGLGEFYVIAQTATDAESRLKKMLNDADYGFYVERQVVEWHLIAVELGEFPEGKANFSSKNKLIFPKEFNL